MDEPIDEPIQPRIVKFSTEGDILVATEPQLTDIFDLYLPTTTMAIQRLSKQETKLLLNLLQADDETINKIVEQMLESFEYKVIAKRISPYPIMFGTRLKIFINLISTSVGNAVLWICIFQYMAQRRKTDIYTLEMFCEDFPMGIYSEAQMNEMWHKQKQDGRNMVDIYSSQTKLFIKQPFQG